MTYSERIAASRAKYAKLIPPTPEPSITPPKFYSVLPFKLSPGKRDYYILITEHNTTTPTHLLHLHQCGETMANTRHLFHIHEISPNTHTLSDIIGTDREPNAPQISGFSLPVVFHSLTDITTEAKRIITVNLND